MIYEFPLPDYEETDEERILRVLEHLRQGGHIADLIRKDIVDPKIVQKRDFPEFLEAALLNGMIENGLLLVHISPKYDGNIKNPHHNQREFLITDEGCQYYDDRQENV